VNDRRPANGRGCGPDNGHHPGDRDDRDRWRVDEIHGKDRRLLRWKRLWTWYWPSSRSSWWSGWSGCWWKASISS